MLIGQLEMKTAMLVLVRVDESCYSRAVCENTFSVKSSSLYLFRLLLRQIAHKITLFYFNTSFKIS